MDYNNYNNIQQPQQQQQGNGGGNYNNDNMFQLFQQQQKQQEQLIQMLQQQNQMLWNSQQPPFAVQPPQMQGQGQQNGGGQFTQMYPNQMERSHNPQVQMTPQQMQQFYTTTDSNGYQMGMGDGGSSSFNQDELARYLGTGTADTQSYLARRKQQSQRIKTAIENGSVDQYRNSASVRAQGAFAPPLDGAAPITSNDFQSQLDPMLAQLEGIKDSGAKVEDIMNMVNGSNMPPAQSGRDIAPPPMNMGMNAPVSQQRAQGPPPPTSSGAPIASMPDLKELQRMEAMKQMQNGNNGHYGRYANDIGHF